MPLSFAGAPFPPDPARLSTANTFTADQTIIGNISATNTVLSSATIVDTLSISSVQIRTRPTANVFIGDSTTGNNSTTGNHNFVVGLTSGNQLTSGNNNTFIGSCAGRVATTSTNNVFLGNCAGNQITSGSSNVFIGLRSGENITTGTDNIFIGRYSGFGTGSSGCRNVFLGTCAGKGVSTGAYNVAIGHLAGNGSGADNIFIGRCAGTTASGSGLLGNVIIGGGSGSGTIGACNVVLGFGVGTTTLGTGNVNIGHAATLNFGGNCNVIIGTSQGAGTGTCNIIIGRGSRITTSSAVQGNLLLGIDSTSSGSNMLSLSTLNLSIRSSITDPSGVFGGRRNVFIGDTTTGNVATSGNDNFAFGQEAGRSLTFGNNNLFLGRASGSLNTTGNSNNFFGLSAGCTNTIGSNNTIIGNTANVATSSLSGVIAIGTGAIATESHQIVLSTQNVLFRSTGNTLEIGSPSFANSLTVYGNISATQTLNLSGASLITPVRRGVIEYDGTTFYATPNTSFGRAAIPTTLYTSGIGTAGTAATTNFALFPSTQDTITLPVGTYLVRLGVRIAVAGSTVSATALLNLRGAGTAIGSFSWRGTSSILDSGASANISVAATALGTAFAVTVASAGNPRQYNIIGEGILKVTTQGTIIPAYQYSATLTGGTTTLVDDNYLIIQSLDTQSAVAFGPAGAGWA